MGPKDDILHPEIPDEIPGIVMAEDATHDNDTIDILEPSPEELVQVAVECTDLIRNANTAGVTTDVDLVDDGDDDGDDDDDPPKTEP